MRTDPAGDRLNDAIEQADDGAGSRGAVEQAETARSGAEQDRVDAEYRREAAERSRRQAEGRRVRAEDDRETAEALRVAAEDARRAAEALRAAGELAREAAVEQREVIREMRVTLAALEAEARKARESAG